MMLVFIIHTEFNININIQIKQDALYLYKYTCTKIKKKNLKCSKMTEDNKPRNFTQIETVRKTGHMRPKFSSESKGEV